MKKIILSLSMFALLLPVLSLADGGANDLTCSPSTSTVAVGQPVTLTVSSTSIKVTNGNAKQMHWSALTGSPDYGVGYTFTTSYSTAGTYTVIVAYNGAGRVTDYCEVVVQ